MFSLTCSVQLAACSVQRAACSACACAYTRASQVLALLEEALRAELEDTGQLPQDRSVCQVRRRGRRGLKLPPAWNGSGC